jgi:ubiquitin-conjugating enzyme E2 D/E
LIIQNSFCIFSSSNSAEKRLAKDLQEWNKDPLPKCSLERIVDVQPWEFQLIMQGPRTSPYEGGTFYFSIKLAAQYPFLRPKVTCTTKIFHPNINENGFICIDMLEDPWKPTITLRTLAITLHSLLETPNIGDLLAPHAAYLYQANRNEFNKIAKRWTEDYAMGSKECTVEVSRLPTTFKEY